jgi:hypothetical protein
MFANSMQAGARRRTQGEGDTGSRSNVLSKSFTEEKIPILLPAPHTAMVTKISFHAPSSGHGYLKVLVAFARF